MNKKNSNENKLWKRYLLTQEVFEEPLNMTKHEDAKAGQILASMAFLTAAAATIFSVFVNNNVRFYISWFKVDLIPILFLLYIVFVVQIIN